MATMYKGGVLVPVLMGTFITVVVFSIERFITIGKSKVQETLKCLFKKNPYADGQWKY